MNYFKNFIILFIILNIVCLQGCVIAPVIDAYSQIGLSRGDRERLLTKQVKAFNEKLYWGKPAEAMQYVKDAERGKAAGELKAITEGVRIVESQIDGIEYDESSYKAAVTVLVKSYKVPYFVVTDRKERQHWEFSFSNGWEFVSIEEVKA